MLAHCIGLLAILRLETNVITDGALVGTTLAQRCAELEEPEYFSEVRSLVDNKIVTVSKNSLGEFQLIWDNELQDYRAQAVST